MAEIRPLERADLPEVARLVAAELPGYRRSADWLERALVDHPWAPAVLPSLVAVEGGRVIGSVGAQRRRLLLGERELSGVSVSHLVVERGSRGGAAGALLVRRLLAGGQDLTWTDSGTPGVLRIWRLFGARLDHVRAANWMLVLRPLAWATRLPGLRGGRRRRELLPVPALPLQAAGPRVAASAFPAAEPGITWREAEADELSRLPLPGVRLRVAHDAESLTWTFAHLATLGAPLVARAVLRDGAPIGWFAYLRRAGAGRVLHVAAGHGDLDAVFAAMLDHARGEGVTALSGRMEPHLDEPVRRRFAALSLGQRPLLHARDPEVGALCGSRQAVISEMELVDSEWW